MTANHRTARGIPVDMDRLRLANEQTIAVGNMKVNARGDQLGAGGKIIKTRQQVMAEKNKLKGPIADNSKAVAESMNTVIQETVNINSSQTETSIIEEENLVADVVPGYVKPRGSFADSVAKETEVTQELLDPSILPSSKPTGIQRI